eukprot:354265-Chlamydomonas_euryale.AAC.4
MQDQGTTSRAAEAAVQRSVLLEPLLHVHAQSPYACARPLLPSLPPESQGQGSGHMAVLTRAHIS